MRSSCEIYSMKYAFYTVYRYSTHSIDTFYTFCAFCRLTKKHITAKESTDTFPKSALCINKINTTTTAIKEAFIY